ncbi:glutamine-hydrolyzing carbamoyl-phosphate synthase small subunit [Thioalkalivibrio sp. HK1]|uniref:glutamine-hydrolyzing carbamoyl-phosphate synthase small subunit n=1 Tax=Thioalkalivibrio sp. HK1 TaxID=1469245 RepID=UPI0004BA81F7|nr:glutamine-hydrolyzing carbamoyl-phosphate synthase small subunit [Thioalkalivibrio sp. HK1]
MLADGTLLWGHGAGAVGTVVGELCFNTSMTGYQEILSDPSYAGQIITFTFPHIGNTGFNLEDHETDEPVAKGCVLRASITEPSNWRSQGHLDEWLKKHGLVAITDVDTRKLVRRLRDRGAISCALIHAEDASEIDPKALHELARAWPGLEGMDLAGEVSTAEELPWRQSAWKPDRGYGVMESPERHVVALDYGAKHNILRCLATLGCRVTVLPANTPEYDILAQRPDGIFLSNGPGDPAATAAYAVPTLRRLIECDLPIFGICLGHQMLALALGARTRKMHHGHRGANHPVRDIETGQIEITSQNHGFEVDADSLPSGVIQTHVSLFDGSNEGLRVEGRPIFSVQHHPEASPGPHDSHHLFQRFVDAIDDARSSRKG